MSKPEQAVPRDPGKPAPAGPNLGPSPLLAAYRHWAEWRAMLDTHYRLVCALAHRTPEDRP